MDGCIAQRDAAMFASLIDRHISYCYLPFSGTQKYSTGLRDL